MKKSILKTVLIIVVAAFLSSCTSFDRSPVDPNVFLLPELPDIGEFTGNVSGRFYEEITYDFIPSNEYGTVIPFVASARVFETPKNEGDDWHAEVQYSSYGFCTPDGKIVMDASDKNTYINFRKTDDGFGFYTVMREVNAKDDAPDEFTPSETYLIPVDGSWCIKLDSRSWLSNSGGGYFNVCKYENEAANSDVCTLVYDYDGNLVKELGGVDSTGAYTNGLMLASTWVADGYRAYFINDDGERVLGPYSAASDFNSFGFTAVEDEFGAYLINTCGERLTDYYKEYFREYSADGTKHAFVFRRHDNNTCDVYSEKGEFSGTFTGSSYFSLRFPDNGEIYGYYTASNNDKYSSLSDRMIWKRLSDGKAFVSEKFRVSPNSYSGTDNCFIHLDKEKNKAYVFDGNGKTIAEINGANDVLVTSEYGDYIVYVEGEYDYSYVSETEEANENLPVTHIYNSDKKEVVFSLNEQGTYARFADEDGRFILVSAYDSMAFFGGVEKYWLFDTKSGNTVFENCNDIKLFDVDGKTYINVCKENCATLYDEDYKIVLRNYYE